MSGAMKSRVRPLSLVLTILLLLRLPRLVSAALLNPIYVPNQPEDEDVDEEVEPSRGSSN